MKSSLTLLFVVGLCAITFNANAQIDDLYGKGKDLYGAQNYSEAIKNFEEVLKLRPFDTAYLWLGTAYRMVSNYESGLKAINKAIELNPSFADAYYERGHINLALKKIPESYNDYSKVIELRPDAGTAYRQRSQIYMMSRQFDLALKDSDNDLRLSGKDIDAYINRIQIRLASRDSIALLKETTQALKLFPQSALLYKARGFAYQLQKNYDSSIINYTKAIALDSNKQEKDIYHNRGVAYCKKGAYQLAIEDLTKDISSNNDSSNKPASYGYRAKSYEGLKQYELAIKDYNKVIELSPQNPKPYAHVGEIYQQLGKTLEAENNFKKAKELGYKEEAE